MGPAAKVLDRLRKLRKKRRKQRRARQRARKKWELKARAKRRRQRTERRDRERAARQRARQSENQIRRQNEARNRRRTAQDIITRDKQGSILEEFPAEYLGKTWEQIKRDAKRGVDAATKAKKLLTDGRFDKQP